jgi:hypothetical protein
MTGFTANLVGHRCPLRHAHVAVNFKTPHGPGGVGTGAGVGLAAAG